MTNKSISDQDVIRFWFEELEPKQHFIKDTDLDKSIKSQFGDIHLAATYGELERWRYTPQGRLAEIIVLDQFSRNIYRGTPQAFAYDTTALVLAQEAVRLKADEHLPLAQRMFIYMPYMHSESAHIHEQALELFNVPGAAYSYEFELKHKAMIDQFGRYPHRNTILDRESTAKEIAFLKQPDSSF